jgi:transposase InsO family protein
MTGYYRNCIPAYAHVAEPLVKLTKKNHRMQFGPAEAQAFQKLKQLLCSPTVLTYPDTSKPYTLYSDASDTCVGSILVQEVDGVERVVQYVSHQLSGSQLNWPTIEKEAYAIIYSLVKLRTYLFGADFRVLVDHKPLKSLFTSQMNNTRLQRWSILLSEYGAKIDYRKGSTNVRADFLSRLWNSEIPEKDDIDKQVVQMATIDTDEWVDIAQLRDDGDTVLIPLDVNNHMTRGEIGRHQHIEFSEQFDRADEEDDQYIVINNLLYSTYKPTPTSDVYPRLLLPSPFWEAVIDRAHKEVGHMAVTKTLDRVREAYVWPGMKRDIKERLARCTTCQAHRTDVDRVPMGTMPIANYPTQMVSVDLIGPMPVGDSGNRYCLNVLDHCSGWVESIPLPNKESKTIEKAFAKFFVSRHGIPEVLLSDNGREFTARDFELYLEELGVQHRLTTPYHPQANGKVERFHRTLKQTLAKLVRNNPTAWESKLPEALLAYRVAISASTGYSPFYLMYGRQPRLPLTRSLLPETTFETRVDDLSDALKNVARNTEQSREANRKRIGARARAGIIIVGDTAIVKVNNRVPLTTRWDPRYQVVRVSDTTIYLRHQRSGKTRRVHRSQVHLVDPYLQWDEVPDRPRQVPLVTNIAQPPLYNVPEVQNEARDEPPVVLPDVQARNDEPDREDDEVIPDTQATIDDDDEVMPNLVDDNDNDVDMQFPQVTQGEPGMESEETNASVVGPKDVANPSTATTAARYGAQTSNIRGSFASRRPGETSQMETSETVSRESPRGPQVGATPRVPASADRKRVGNREFTRVREGSTPLKLVFSKGYPTRSRDKLRKYQDALQCSSWYYV